MTTAGIEPDPAEPFAPPTATPRRATSGGGSTSNTVPGPAKPRRAKDPNGGPSQKSGPALLQLTAEVGGDATVVWQFVSDYLDLLDHRMAAVETAITAGNAERAEVALLSLESTSLMVGADAIVRAVRPIRVAVGQGDFGSARDRLAALRRARTTDRSRLERARDDHGSAD
ncbi:hypothetical protein [Microlunatus speluncae]|uniref:hypothetical protein n=1 Tax=Microlunatus speluncae TaxID=2594267 RepID=UPI0012661144|nr:hypothetical protein [Microlunatus speluncae]